MSDRDPHEHLEHLLGLERLTATLADRAAGDYFGRDLQEARALATADARFVELAAGLHSPTLGARLQAVDRFFAGLPRAELVAMALPAHLAQLRAIFLSSRPSEP